MNDFSPLSTSPQRLKLRVEDFDVLIDSGAFDGLSKVELIDGELLLMSPQHTPHARMKTEIGFRLHAALNALGSRYAALIEATISIPPNNAPEPDVVLTSEPNGREAVPIDSVPLLVEISASTLDYDLGRKAAIYARAGIPEYWIVSIDDRVILQLSAPGAEGYAVRVDTPLGEPIAAVAIPGLTIETAGL